MPDKIEATVVLIGLALGVLSVVLPDSIKDNIKNFFLMLLLVALWGGLIGMAVIAGYVVFFT